MRSRWEHLCLVFVWPGPSLLLGKYLRPSGQVTRQVRASLPRKRPAALRVAAAPLLPACARSPGRAL